MNLKFRISLVFMIVIGIASLLQGVARQISLMNSIAGRPYLSGPYSDVLATSTPLYFLPESSAEVVPVNDEKYSPTRFGIPKAVGVFEIVAVVSRDQNPCVPQDALLVIFHIPDSVPQDTLTQKFQQAEGELKAINPNIIMISAGPMEDRAAYFAGLDRNVQMARADAAAGRCGVILGGPSGPSGLNPPKFPTLPADRSFPVPESSAEILPESSAEVLPVDREKYSPARYGIPETLGGLQVVAVISHETNPCSVEGFMNVMLQGPDLTMDDYLQNSTTQQSISTAMQELKAIYPNPAASISVGGPIEDMDALFRQLEENRLAGEQAVANGGCVRSGPIIPASTYETVEAPDSEPFQMIATAMPTSTLSESSAATLAAIRETYAPARYGIPATLSGFEVLAVVTQEQNPCWPKGLIVVYLQGVDATVKDYLRGDSPAKAEQAALELKRINSKATVSVSVRIDDLDTFYRQLDSGIQEANKPNGCALGGPIIPASTYETVEAPDSEPFQEIPTATPLR